jgi:hypothetical protein
MPATAAAALAGSAARFPAGEKHQMLRKLAAYLLAPLQAQAAATLLSPGIGSSSSLASSSSSSAAVVNILSPSIDIHIQLQGFGISLVSETRELLYGCCRGLNARFSQDAVRRAIGFTVGSIRVENTLHGCQYPLLLASPVSRSVFGVVVHSPAGLAGGAAAAAAAAGSSSSEVQQAAAASDAAAEDDEDALGETSDSAVQQHTAAVSEVISEAAAAAAAAAATATTALADSSTAVDSASQATAAAMAAFAAAAQLLQQQPPQEQQQQQQQQPPMLLPHQLAFGVLATVWRTQPSGVLCVEQLGVQVSPCALSLEGKHLKQLVDFAQSIQAAAAADAAAISYALPGNGSRGSAQLLKPSAAAAAGVLAPVLPPSLPAASAGKRGLKLYFEQWQMSAITLCVSFAPDSWFDPLPGGATAAAAAAAAGAVKDLDSSSSSSSSSSGVGKALASAVASIDMATEVSAAAEAASDAASSIVAQTEAAAAAGNTSSKQATELDPIPGSSSSITATALAEQHSSSSSSSGAAPLPVWLQMALALAHAEEGAWLTLGSFERSHTMINTDSLVQVRAAGQGQTRHLGEPRTS